MSKSIFPDFKMEVPMPDGATFPPKVLVRFAFDVGDKVTIDSDPEIHGTVTGLVWYGDHAEYRVARFHSGSMHEAWFSPLRLTLMEDAR